MELGSLPYTLLPNIDQYETYRYYTIFYHNAPNVNGHLQCHLLSNGNRTFFTVYKYLASSRNVFKQTFRPHYNISSGY